MNNLLESQSPQQQQQQQQQQQSEKLLKAFSMFGNPSGSGGEQRRAESPAASLRSNASSYKRARAGEGEEEGGEDEDEETSVANKVSSPVDDASAYGSECSMQPFLFECRDESFLSNFVPCMVYLPVKSKLDSPVSVRVTLKPLDPASTSAAAVAAMSEENEENEDTEENYE